MDEELRAEIRKCVIEAVREAFEFRVEMLWRDPSRQSLFEYTSRLEGTVARLEATTLQLRSWASGCKYNASEIASILQLAKDIDSKV